jgi:hypothetical protein
VERNDVRQIWFTSTGVFFGVTGVLIVFNPVIAILTSTGPPAPFHIPMNWSGQHSLHPMFVVTTS